MHSLYWSDKVIERWFYMKITAIKYRDARKDGVLERYTRHYTDHKSLNMVETLTQNRLSDFTDKILCRTSTDNGHTWSEWENSFDISATNASQGNHQINYTEGYNGGGIIWNPVHKHYIKFSFQRIFINGYQNAEKKYWEGDSSDLVDHTFIEVYNDDEILYKEMIKYQDGPEFDSKNWANPNYIKSNRCIFQGNAFCEPNGDIMFCLEAPMRVCCELACKDILDVFPSYPDFPNGIIVFRGVWNGQRYDISPSRPIIISDILSSRGLNEPAMAKLSSGRIVVIMRGANHHSPEWTKKRIAPGTPAVKWYAWSDDNGKTFTDPMPWHFDDGEIIYSSGSYSKIILDERTGKHYWIGNITEYGSGTAATDFASNYFRYPLNIVEIDETYGTAKKESHKIIDDRREGESKWIQLSNFDIIQNRETGNFEITLSKCGQFSPTPVENPFEAEVWRYIIELD